MHLMMQRIAKLIIHCGILSIASGGHFYGGSMSYQAYDGQDSIKVKLKILTGWKFRTGPCGPHCNESRINQDTLQTRKEMIILKNDLYFFGEWTLETKYFGNEKPVYENVTTSIVSNAVERLLMANSHAGWETEAAEVELPVPKNASYTDIIYEGLNWEPLSCQLGVNSWHMQVKIYAYRRSDTSNQNSSPLVLSQLFYRLPINKRHTLNFPTVDADEDAFRCRWSQFIEAGQLSETESVRLKGVTVLRNCTVIINTGNGYYSLNDTGAIAITVEDFSRSVIELQRSDNEVILASAYRRPLSAVTVQFYIGIVEDFGPPVILSPPTPPVMQIFIIYVGVRFSVGVYAKPSDLSRNIEKITFQTRESEPVNVTDKDQRPDIGPKVVMVTASWVPSLQDVGDHILSAAVKDNLGYESLDLYSFIVKVKNPKQDDSLVLPSSTKVNPRFLDFPRSRGIRCEINSVCLFPIYAESDITGGIQNITVASTEIRNKDVKITTGNSRDNNHNGTKMATVEINCIESGEKKICFKASDLQGTVQKCLFLSIRNKDPCEGVPCVNSGQCVSNENNGDYRCKCQRGISGRNCQTVNDLCKDHPCKNNGTCHQKSTQVFCMCPNLYTGAFCEQVVDLCADNPCGEHGVCEQHNTNISCHCVNGYAGSDCKGITHGHQDICRPHLCTGHSVCIPDYNQNSYTCACTLGYRPPDCTKAQYNQSTNGSSPKFVPPTPGTGFEINCNKLDSSGCYLAVYVLSWDNSFVIHTVVKPPGLNVVMNDTDGDFAFNNQIDPAVFFVPVVILKDDLQLPEKDVYNICLGVGQNRSASNLNDMRCFKIHFVENVWTDGKALNTVGGHGFTSPTQTDGSTLACVIRRRCSFFVYTKSGSGSNNTVCEKVVVPRDAMVGTSSKNMTSGICQTEVVLPSSSTPTSKDICVKSWGNGDSRCYMVKFIDVQDACLTSPCRNNGVCQTLENGSYVCHCKSGYRGVNCEKGRCSDQICHHNGVCYTDGLSTICHCRPCFYGHNCERNVAEKKSVNISANKISKTAKAVEIVCPIHIQCKVPVEFSSLAGEITEVQPGQLSQGIDYEDLVMTHHQKTACIYKFVAVVIGRVEGQFLVCVNVTLNISKVPEEVCEHVTVKNEKPVLVDKLKPYFIPPTMPNKTELLCKHKEHCHLSLWVSNRDGKNTCPDLKSSKHPEEGVFIYPADVNTSPCMYDVIFNTAVEKGLDVCFTPTTPFKFLIGGNGERRCYHIMEEPNTNVNKSLPYSTSDTPLSVSSNSPPFSKSTIKGDISTKIHVMGTVVTPSTTGMGSSKDASKGPNQGKTTRKSSKLTTKTSGKSPSVKYTSPATVPSMVTNNDGTDKNGHCPPKSMLPAKKAAENGHVVCDCKDISTGTTRRIININVKVTIGRKLRAAAIGGAGSCILLIICGVVFTVFRKCKKPDMDTPLKTNSIKPSRNGHFRWYQ